MLVKLYVLLVFDVASRACPEGLGGVHRFKLPRLRLVIFILSQ
jgi:hypothetical protein